MVKLDFGTSDAAKSAMIDAGLISYFGINQIPKDLPDEWPLIDGYSNLRQPVAARYGPLILLPESNHPLVVEQQQQKLLETYGKKLVV